MKNRLSIVRISLMLIPLFLLLISSIIGYFQFKEHTSKVEIVSFPSSLPDLAPNEVTITNGRIYYPKNYIYGKKYPVIIYVHGFQVTKETDLRLIFELTKRGIFALAIDLPGHGQSNSRLCPYFWKVAIGAVDYIYSRPDIFNLSAVGLIGHSMGGWTTFLAMGYESARKNRINISISWAGIFNTTSFRNEVIDKGQFDSTLKNIKVDISLFENTKYLYDHNPINYYLNKSLGAQPKPDKFGSRILIVHGSNDDLVNINQAIEANNTLKSNCTLEIIPGESHLLLGNIAIIKSIQYIELHFFGYSESEFEISNNLTFINVYLCYFLGLIGLYFTILSCIFIIWFIYRDKFEFDINYTYKNWKFIIISFLLYIGAIFIFYLIQIYVANVLLSLLIFSVIIGVPSIITAFYFKINNIQINKLKKMLTLRNLSYQYYTSLIGFHLGLLAIFGYWFMANCYAIFVYQPLNFEYFIYSIFYLIPIVFFNEFYWRKLIQDVLPIKNRWFKRLFMIIPIIFANILIINFYDASFLSLTAFGICFTAVTLTNIFIYSKYKTIASTIIFSVIILSFIAGNCYYFFI